MRVMQSFRLNTHRVRSVSSAGNSKSETGVTSARELVAIDS